LTEASKPHQALQEITPEQWDDIIDQLMGFTFNFFTKRLGGDISKAQTPDGNTFEDLAQETVLRVLAGSRKWNPEKDGDLLPYMAGQIKSLFDHDLKSWNARNIESVKDGEQIEDEAPVAFVARPEYTNPETVLIDREDTIEKDRLLEVALEAVQESSNEELWALMEVYLDDSGEYKPRHMAKRLGIPTTELHNIQKRLVRCVQKYVKEKKS